MTSQRWCTLHQLLLRSEAAPSRCRGWPRAVATANWAGTIPAKGPQDISTEAEGARAEQRAHSHSLPRTIVSGRLAFTGWRSLARDFGWPCGGRVSELSWERDALAAYAYASVPACALCGFVRAPEGGEWEKLMCTAVCQSMSRHSRPADV